MKYEKAEMEIIEFNQVDTIIDSGTFNNGGDGSTGGEPDIDIFG